MVRDDDTLSVRVVLGTTRTTEHLQHVLRRQLDPTTLLGVVDLRALYDDCMRGKVDTPRERRSADKHLEVPIGEELLNQPTVFPRHAGVMDTETELQEILEVRVLHVVRLLQQDLAGGALAF